MPSSQGLKRELEANEEQHLVCDELTKIGGAVEMLPVAETKVVPLGVDTGDMLQGNFHAFYMDDITHESRLRNLLEDIA